MSPAVFILFLAALVLFFALFSFWKAMMSFLNEREASPPESTEKQEASYDPFLLSYAPLNDLDRKKEQALMQLKDLEREEKLGRITSLDYQVLREELLVQTRELFAQEEELLLTEEVFSKTLQTLPSEPETQALPSIKGADVSSPLPPEDK